MLPLLAPAACEMLLLERKSTAACEMLSLERKNRMRNAPPGKGIHSRMRNAPPGKEKPHAKCSLPERDSLPIDFMLE